jgi:hypothetical protein
MKHDRLLLVWFLAALLVGCTGQSLEPPKTIVPIPTQEHFDVTTSGTITKDEIWKGEIHLTGDVFIKNNAILTIMPGTIIYIASNSDDQNSGVSFDDEYTRSHNDPVRLDSWTQSAIQINGIDGTIIAVGTPDKKIVFRPEGNNTSPAQWEGIVIRRGTIQQSILLYAGQVGINVWQPFEPVEIAYNEVRYVHWCGIQGDSDAWIHHNLVEGGGHQGINCSGDCMAEHNTVLNSQTGISIENGNGVIVRNNLVVNSLLGISLRSGKLAEILNNTIIQSGELPDGFYYQGQLIYPAGEAGNGGIWTFGQGNVKIVNNIVYGPMECAFGLHVAPVDGSQIDYNLAWGYQNLTCGGATSIIGANILSEDPLFIDVFNMDFHVLPDSPAIDAGVPDLLDADDSPSDLGAYGGPQGTGW